MRYVERLTPSGLVWFSGMFIVVGISLSLSPLGLQFTLVLFTVLTAALLLILIRTTPRVTVGEGQLRAGRARIPLALTGQVDVLDKSEMRQALGPGLDVRAYLCQRGWIRTGVRVQIVDPDDPTPYWLISSRHPSELATALTTERGEAGVH